MNDTTPTHCGHDPRYIVQADEGTAYCVMCELEAARKKLSEVSLVAQNQIDNHCEKAYVMSEGEHKSCFCDVCALAREVLS